MKIEKEDNIRFIGTTRGFVTLLLHGIYKKVKILFYYIVLNLYDLNEMMMF